MPTPVAVSEDAARSSAAWLTAELACGLTALLSRRARGVAQLGHLALEPRHALGQSRPSAGTVQRGGLGGAERRASSRPRPALLFLLAEQLR